MDSFLDTAQLIVVAIFGIIFIFFLASWLYFSLFEKEGEEEPKGCVGKFILCIVLVLGSFFLVSMCRYTLP